MNEELKNVDQEKAAAKSGRKDFRVRAALFVFLAVLVGMWIYGTDARLEKKQRRAELFAGQGMISVSEQEAPLPKGIILPVHWGDLGMKMTSVGLIDRGKFDPLYAVGGGLKAQEKELLESASNEPLVMSEENAGFLLNLFWALGLGTKNDILEKGPMRDPRYGGVDRFASTAGWTLATGDVMDHYSRHPFIVLTPDQQRLVERVSKNIYRPCCSNPTHFPDCNHGMAMLGLLELMAAQGVSEEDMYRAAFRVNTLWFPETYQTVVRYFASQGKDWNAADPKEILGPAYSSASGYQNILKRVPSVPHEDGFSCGVQESPAKRNNKGCGA